MLKKYTHEDYIKAYEELPKDVQKLFWDNDMGNRIKRASTRYNLTEEEESLLFKVVAQLFLGITPPSQLKELIKDAFPENLSDNLFNEIVRFIIYPAQVILRKLYADEEFDKIGVKGDFSEEKEKEWRTQFGDTYREQID